MGVVSDFSKHSGTEWYEQFSTGGLGNCHSIFTRKSTIANVEYTDRSTEETPPGYSSHGEICKVRNPTVRVHPNAGTRFN
ncbi:hypothetical protein ZHAS_00000879 [Anopheles sinensis]|uniref:Uncharacterized protein n=1 Tax=Anopheles sinensis TaxID=74873 RepID=A0A084VAR4_ANOSI|nr:hypothetical protein ZHAS_00000879 [Anopheles sinensis]